MSALADFHLLRPAWLLAALPMLWLLWRSRHLQTAGSQWARACDPALLNAMLHDRGATSPWPRILASVAAVILTLALAGPTWQRLPTPVLQSEAASVIVLDLSKSMDAADLQPSRLGRARFAALDVLSAMPEGRIGVVSFAGSAFTVVPLTDDRETARHLINSLRTDVMPIQGGRIGTGLAQALTLLRNAGASNGRVILLTDSTPDQAALRQAEALQTAGHQLQIIGFGSRSGAPIPADESGWIKGRDGNIVLARLDAAALNTLADRGGGSYLTLPTAGLADIARQWTAPATSGRRSHDDLTTDRWLDAGQWLVWLLLPLCALGARRGWLAQGLLVVAGLSAMTTAPPSYADDGSLWRNADQRGKALLDAGDAARAQEAFQSRDWRGVAAYEAGDYGAAAEAFAASDLTDADYNRGNALARAGDLQAALDAYDAQLDATPDHADAQHNRALVQALMDQQQQQSGESGDSGDDEQQPPDQQRQSDEQQQQTDGESQDSQQAGQGQDNGDQQQDRAGEEQQQAGNQQESDAEPDDQQREQQQAEAEAGEDRGEQTAAEAQAMSDEDRAEQQAQQALEQWLRRVPDDPGGLLRRKFALEQARRNDAEEGEQAW